MITSFTILGTNGTTIEKDYVKIESCGCEACQYNPFATASVKTVTIAPLI